MSPNNIRSGRQSTSGTSSNRDRSTSREDKNESITRKRTESPRGGKEKANPPIRKRSASPRLTHPSKSIGSQALVPLGCNSGVATVGRVRTPPNVIGIYGTLGQLVVNRIYRSMLKYNEQHSNFATLGFVSNQPRTFDLRCHRTVTAELRRLILHQGSEAECFVIQEVEVPGFKDNHCTFRLKERGSPVKLPRVLELSQSERDQLRQATVDKLISLSQKSNIFYLTDYYSKKGREFNRNTYKQEVKKNKCWLLESYGFRSGCVPRDKASYLSAAINHNFLLGSERLILDCSLAIVLAFVLAYEEVLKSEKLWDLLYESDSSKSSKQSIQITFDSANFITWNQCNYMPSSTWKWNVGDLVYIQGPRYGFVFKPTSVSNGFNALVSNTAPLKFRSFRSYRDKDVENSLEEYEDVMMKAFKKPLSHQDISDIWGNLQEHPEEFCGAGKSPITWNEVWKSLVGVYGLDCLNKAVTAATAACEKGRHTPKRDSTPKILVPPQYCEQYVGLTTVQRMYPDNVSFY